VANQSSWRRAVGGVERELGPPLTRVAGSRTFARALGVTVKVTRSADRMVKNQFARVWHTFNLPAATDVRRLREMVGDLDREIQQVQRQLDAQEGGQVDGSQDSVGFRAKPQRSAGGNKARRPAERPEGT
jgi:hypothetical protein